MPTASGGLTTLGSVADVDFQAGPAADHPLRPRATTSSSLADLTDGAQLGDAHAEVNNLPIMQHLPPGVRHEPNIGSQQAQTQLFVGFGIAIFAGIGLVYGVMVLLFGSFFKPLTILSALPLGDRRRDAGAADLATRSCRSRR